ncbi:MAG: hypothetical protein M1823_009112, partial [Watsoniomyces obsoletus]
MEKDPAHGAKDNWNDDTPGRPGVFYATSNQAPKDSDNARDEDEAADDIYVPHLGPPISTLDVHEEDD